MAYLNQDLSNVTADSADRPVFRVIPDGEYAFIITGSEYKSAASSKGMVLHLKLECLEADHKGTRLMDFLTLEHENKQTVEIAQKRLRQVAEATGHRNPNFVKMSEELHGKPFTAVIRSESARNPKYGDVAGMQNKVAAYKKLNGKKADQVDAQELAEINDAVDNAVQTDDDIPF